MAWREEEKQGIRFLSSRHRTLRVFFRALPGAGPGFALAQNTVRYRDCLPFFQASSHCNMVNICLPSLATAGDTNRLNAKAKRVMITIADPDIFVNFL